MGSKFEDISDDHSYVPCSALLGLYLFSFPALILMLFYCLCTKKLLLAYVYYV